MTHNSNHHAPARVLAAIFWTALAGILLCSCATSPTSSVERPYRFTVLRYEKPVNASSWNPDPTFAADPEGAALNITSAMRQGDIETWLAYWDAPERGAASATDRQALAQQWQSLQGCSVSVLGRVIAEADVIVELLVMGPQQSPGKLQIPLKHSNGRWWLTSLEPTSEYLNWESSPNKIIAYIDPGSLQRRLNATQSAR